MESERMFRRYIGIDYSGTDKPVRSIGGLAVCTVDADGNSDFPDPLKTDVENWNRKDVARWLVKRLQEQNTPTLVGIDHGFSFPIDYFRRYHHLLEGNWDYFLDDFQEYWPTDRDAVTVRSQCIRQIECMIGERQGNFRFGVPDWFRLTDPRGASSVFDFMRKRGEVATSTHAGIPWLRYIRRKLEEEGVRVHFWPFDGWNICESRSVVVEAYPSIWKDKVESKGKNTHQRDAYVVARRMSVMDQESSLSGYFKPELNVKGYARAKREGWILGVPRPRYPEYGRGTD